MHSPEELLHSRLDTRANNRTAGGQVSLVRECLPVSPPFILDLFSVLGVGDICVKLANKVPQMLCKRKRLTVK